MMKTMPITKRKDGWYWGGQGPFGSRKKAEEIAQAAHASGYEGMEKAYGEQYKPMKFDRKQNKRTMQAMNKEAATTGMTGDMGTGPSIFTPTHGAQKTMNKKELEKLQEWLKVEKEDLDGDDLTTFTTAGSYDRGYPAQTNNRKKTKYRSGIERAGSFIDNFSPKMEKNEDSETRYKKGRRRITQEMIGTASPTPNTDTIPTHSHQSTYFHKDEKSLVLDLINFARTELQKEKRYPVATGASRNVYFQSNDPHQPHTASDRAGKGVRDGTTPSKHSPPAGVDKNNVVNMGHSGSFEQAIGVGDVANDDGSVAKVGGRVPKKKRKLELDNDSIMTVNVPNANPVQIEAMQKYGIGNFHTTPPVRHTGSSGNDEHPQSLFVERDQSPADDTVDQEDDFVQRTKKYKRAMTEHGDDTTVIPPTEQAVGSFGMVLGKDGGAYGMDAWKGPVDALHRSGDLDRLDEEEEKELPNDIERELKKQQLELLARWRKA